MIYAEWLDGDRNFHCDIFSTWDDYYKCTFDPDVEILVVRRWHK